LLSAESSRSLSLPEKADRSTRNFSASYSSTEAETARWLFSI
jgi:hypothetical protein